MQRPIFAVLCALAIVGIPHVAVATCTSELIDHGLEPEQPLPSACRAMGQLHLGMTKAEVVKIMGNPTASEPFGHDEEALAYALPHPPGAGDQGTLIAANPDNGFLRIILDSDKVVSMFVLGTESSAAPYSVGDIAVGESVNKLLHSIAAPPLWNETRDNVILGAYPIEVEVNPDTHRLTSIDIFTNWKFVGGPYPAFSEGKICFGGLAGITCQP